MQTCSSLSLHDNCRSFTKRKPNSQRVTKVRLIGGCSFRPAVTFISAMSSISCPATSVKVGNNVSAKKRHGTRRKRSENVHSALSDVNGNSKLPASRASISKACSSTCMQNNVSCTNVRSMSLPVLQSSVDNTSVMLETVPLVSLHRVAEQPETIAVGSSEVVKKQTGRRKANYSAKQTTPRKRKGCNAVAKSTKSTAVKRGRRCTSTTRNDKFLESMTTFVSEVAKNVVSACVEQTFTQLIQKGLLLSPFAYSVSLDNSNVSLLNQPSTISSSNFDQTYRFLQPCIDSLVSTNYPSSASQGNDYSPGVVQQFASASGNFFDSAQSLQPGVGFLGTQIEGIVASNAAAVCNETPASSESATYNSFSASSDSFGTSTCAHTDLGNVACYSQPMQSKNLTDYSLIDLLNMSDDDIDMLLSGFVDCSSDDQLLCSVGSCSVATTNSVVMSMNASTCHTDIPVCCSGVASVTEPFMNMDPFDEECFQPDYFELDDDLERASVAELPSSVTSGESTAGKKITIRKPCSDSLALSPLTRRKRQWRSCSRNDSASSVLSVAVKATVGVSSSVLDNTQPIVSEAQSEAVASEHNSVVLDEVLEGDG